MCSSNYSPGRQYRTISSTQIHESQFKDIKSWQGQASTTVCANQEPKPIYPSSSSTLNAGATDLGICLPRSSDRPSPGGQHRNQDTSRITTNRAPETGQNFNSPDPTTSANTFLNALKSSLNLNRIRTEGKIRVIREEIERTNRTLGLWHRGLDSGVGKVTGEQGGAAAAATVGSGRRRR